MSDLCTHCMHDCLAGHGQFHCCRCGMHSALSGGYISDAGPECPKAAAERDGITLAEWRDRRAHAAATEALAQSADRARGFCEPAPTPPPTASCPHPEAHSKLWMSEDAPNLPGRTISVTMNYGAYTVPEHQHVRLTFDGMDEIICVTWGCPHYRAPRVDDLEDE